MTGKCPFMGRREMLLGLGKAGGAAAVGGLIGRAGIPDAAAQSAPVAGPDDELYAVVSFHGVHQAGMRGQGQGDRRSPGPGTERGPSQQRVGGGRH